ESYAGHVRFSADGRWLSTDLDGGRLFAVGSWKPGPRIGGVGTFSPDGSIVAVPVGDSIHLVDPPNGRKLGALEGPNQQSIGYPVFTPDGTRLIGVQNTESAKGVCVWDLRLLRARLAELGLDWDALPYPPPAGNVPLRPLKVTNRGG